MSLIGVNYLTDVFWRKVGVTQVIRKYVYAAVAAALLAPVPAFAGGDIEPPGYYGDDGYDDAYDDDYAPVVRKEVHKKVIVERPVVVERPIVVERPVVVEKRVVVERPVIVKRRHVIVEAPVRYGYGRPYYAKRFHGKHFDGDYGLRYGKHGYRKHRYGKRGYGKHFDGDYGHRGYGPY